MRFTNPAFFILLLGVVFSFACQKPRAVIVDAQDIRDVAPRDAAQNNPDVRTVDVGVPPEDVSSSRDASANDATPSDALSPDVNIATPDANSAVDALAAPDVSVCGALECTCVESVPAGGCTHSLGGVYQNQGCSGGFQCCDGSFREGLNVCGDCSCQDVTGQEGCGQRSTRCFAAFSATTSVLSESLRAQMTPATWRSGCPVSLDDLRLLTMSHHTFEGEIAQGEMIVAAVDAPAILRIFEAMYDAEFPIASMRLMHNFGGDDDDSMDANNSSAFNCRQITGGSSFSQHSYGNAIDINPVENPYVRGNTVLPPAGRGFTSRSDVRPGMIVSGDAVSTAFFAEGWSWGGNFNALKDYQHFSVNGR